MANTRTERNPSKYHCVTKWGFTHVPWPEFVKRFPKEASDFTTNYLEGWDDEEVTRSGGPDVLTWEALWDDELFVNREGRPMALGNITGPGGSCWLAHDGEDWDEVYLDDEGNVEDF